MHLSEIWHSKKNDCRLSRTQVIKKENRKIYKERQNAYKEEDQYIIRWKGGKMKEDAVSQCPVASFMVWGEALSGKISRLSL